MEMEVSGWLTGMLGTAIAKMEQSMKMKEEHPQSIRLACYMWCGWFCSCALRPLGGYD